MSVYTWGLGKNGQLGIGVCETKHIPQKIKKLRKGKTEELSGKQIDCGALFTAILTQDGAILTSGCGKYGRLGHENGDEDKCSFEPISTGDIRFIQVSCGSWHACAVTDGGDVMSWGYAKACGNNLGRPGLVDFSLPIKVAGVSCGHNYTYAWTVDSGDLYTWGSGHCGVLGHGSEESLPSPRRVEVMQGKKVVSAGAGHSHCGVVTDDGQLYMTGKGSDGALGLNQSHTRNVTTLTLCDTKGSKVKAVSCSKGEHHGHTMALTVDGVVLVWGDGYKGKLGLGHQELIHSPTPIPSEYFASSPVTSVSAGGIHSAATTSHGEVYTWGCGSDGRLGHPEGQGHRYLFRSDIPKKVEALPKVGSSDGSGAMVSCSYYHTAAIV